MGKRVEMYRWRVLWINRWVTTRYHATREDIIQEHPEAVPVINTRIERELCENPMENSLARFYVGFKRDDDLGQ